MKLFILYMMVLLSSKNDKNEESSLQNDNLEIASDQSIKNRSETSEETRHDRHNQDQTNFEHETSSNDDSIHDVSNECNEVNKDEQLIHKKKFISENYKKTSNKNNDYWWFDPRRYFKQNSFCRNPSSPTCRTNKNGSFSSTSESELRGDTEKKRNKEKMNFVITKQPTRDDKTVREKDSKPGSFDCSSPGLFSQDLSSNVTSANLIGSNFSNAAVECNNDISANPIYETDCCTGGCCPEVDCTNSSCTNFICPDTDFYNGSCISYDCPQVDCTNSFCASFSCNDFHCDNGLCTSIGCNDFHCNNGLCTSISCNDFHCNNGFCTNVGCDDFEFSNCCCLSFECPHFECPNVDCGGFDCPSF